MILKASTIAGLILLAGAVALSIMDKSFEWALAAGLGLLGVSGAGVAVQRRRRAK